MPPRYYIRAMSLWETASASLPVSYITIALLSLSEKGVESEEEGRRSGESFPLKLSSFSLRLPRDGWRDGGKSIGCREHPFCTPEEDVSVLKSERSSFVRRPSSFLLSVMLLYLTVALPRVKAELSAAIVTCSSNHFPPFMPQWRRAITITR